MAIEIFDKAVEALSKDRVDEAKKVFNDLATRHSHVSDVARRARQYLAKLGG